VKVLYLIAVYPLETIIAVLRTRRNLQTESAKCNDHDDLQTAYKLVKDVCNVLGSLQKNEIAFFSNLILVGGNSLKKDIHSLAMGSMASCH